jgi:hypothetical protein
MFGFKDETIISYTLLVVKVSSIKITYFERISILNKNTVKHPRCAVIYITIKIGTNKIQFLADI